MTHPEPKQAMKMTRSNLEHVNITVGDPDQTAAVLAELFGWKVRWQGDSMLDGRTVHIGTDDQYVALYGSSQAPEDQTYGQPGALNHIAITVDDLDAAEQRVIAAGFTPENHGDYEPGRRFYFRNEDHIEFEVVSYVDSKATGSNTAPTLSGGIDHLHVYAPDRAEAAHWYEEVMGFEVVESLQFWAEDARGPLTLADSTGRVHLALFARETPKSVSVAFGATASEYIGWRNRFQELGLDPVEKDHKLVWSLYIRDPWGNEIEITTWDVEEVTKLSG